MTRTTTAIAGVLAIVAMDVAAWTAQRTLPAATQDGISVYFSPNGGCTDAIIHQINTATDSIQVQAYTFTSMPIAKAIRDAHRRGVEVTVVLDASQRKAQYSSATFFFNQGVPAFIDAAHAIAHNKVILIDNDTVITGSFNFSRAAEERNAENLLIIEDKPAFMRAYLSNFRDHLQHSVRYAGLSRGPETTVEDDTPIPDDDAATFTVHVTKSGKKYHRAGCRYLKNSDRKTTLKDAKRWDLQPCKVCHPP